MADHHADDRPLETGAEMDYDEHDSTYGLFLAITRWSVIVCVAALIALAFGFFTSAGFVAATFLFLVLVGLGAFFSA